MLDKPLYVSLADCEDKREACAASRAGNVRWLLGVLVSIVLVVVAASFTFALSNRREVTTLDVRVQSQEKRIDRLEQKIDTGFAQVLDRLDKRD